VATALVSIRKQCKSNGIVAPSIKEGRRLTALHEAGHCVLAFHFDREPNSVSIVAHDEFAGSCNGQLGLSEVPSEAEIEGHVAQLLAGHAAVVRAAPRYVRWSRLTAGDDVEKVARFFEPSDASLRRALRLARQIVAMEWTAISSIADALLERDWISGDEAALLIEAAHGKLTAAELANALATVRRFRG
jgi:hypothetical protein